jgi:hypothetical protein
MQETTFYHVTVDGKKMCVIVKDKITKKEFAADMVAMFGKERISKIKQIKREL